MEAAPRPIEPDSAALIHVGGGIANESGVPHARALNRGAGGDVNVVGDQVIPGRKPDNTPARHAVLDGDGVIVGSIANSSATQHGSRAGGLGER